MDSDWHTVLQFVDDPLDSEYAQKHGVHAERPSLQVPTPPVSSRLPPFFPIDSIAFSAIS